jgi:hypothetical protein
VNQKKPPRIRDELQPVAYVHVGAVLALLCVVWFMFGILYALGGLVLASMFWTYWVNQQIRNAESAKITAAIQLRKQQGFQAPPPELMGDRPPTIEMRKPYDEDER